MNVLEKQEAAITCGVLVQRVLIRNVNIVHEHSVCVFMSSAWRISAYPLAARLCEGMCGHPTVKQSTAKMVEGCYEVRHSCAENGYPPSYMPRWALISIKS